jgi:hypothetical protein
VDIGVQVQVEVEVEVYPVDDCYFHMIWWGVMSTWVLARNWVDMIES